MPRFENETVTETGEIRLVCLLRKNTLETETPHTRSRRDLKRCCGVSLHKLVTVTVSNMLDQTGNILSYIKFLKKEGKYIDALLFYTTCIESIIKDTIEIHKESIKDVLKNSSVVFNIDRCINTEKVTLGKLKEYFSYFIDDEKLINKIDSFVIIRNKCVHGLTLKTISEWNKELAEKHSDLFLLATEILTLTREVYIKRKKYVEKKLKRIDKKIDLSELKYRQVKKALRHLKIGESISLDELDKLPDLN